MRNDYIDFLIEQGIPYEKDLTDWINKLTFEEQLEVEEMTTEIKTKKVEAEKKILEILQELEDGVHCVVDIDIEKDYRMTTYETKVATVNITMIVG